MRSLLTPEHRSGSLTRALVRRGVRGAFYVLFGVVGVFRRLLATADEAECEVRSILVIRLDLLGDVLFSMTAAEAVHDRYPGARICMLTLPYTSPLPGLFPFVDEVISVDTNRIRNLRELLSAETWIEYLRVARRLRSRHFDLAISVYGRMGSLCAFLSGARRTVGYAGEAYPFLLTDTLPAGRHRERKHEVEYVLKIARHIGADPVPEHTTLPLRADTLHDGAQRLRAHGIAEGERVVIVHAGSTNGSAKRWPARSWGRFADQVTERTGARIVLIGAASDRAISEDVIGAAHVPIVSLVGETTIPALAAVIAQADLVASGDSGPLHLAVALGRPLLAVYGPTDPRIYGPYRPHAPTVLHRTDLPCSPCYTLAATAECPLGDPICMRLVTVSQMTESAVRLLSQSENEFLVPEQHALQDSK